MRQDVSRSKRKPDYINSMFPYNEHENNWISGSIELSSHNNPVINNFLI